MRHWILIIFGRNVWQECFAGSGQLKDAIISHLTWLSALPCKTGNMEITPLHLRVVCCFVNKHTQKYQNYNLVVVRLFFIHKTINNMHQTWPTQGTKHPAISRRSPCLPWYRAPLWQSFSADVESHRTLSVRFFYYTISTNFNCYQARCWWQFCFQQNSAPAHHACNALKLQESELSISVQFSSFNYYLQLKSPAVKPTEYKI